MFSHMVRTRLLDSTESVAMAVLPSCERQAPKRVSCTKLAARLEDWTVASFRVNFGKILEKGYYLKLFYVDLLDM